MTRSVLVSALMASGARIALAADDAAASTPAPAAAAPKTVAEDMDARRIFDNIEEAVAYLGKCADELSDFDKMAIAAVGMDSEGNFSKDIYTADMQVMVSTLRKQKGGIKAIVVAPIPSFDSILASPEGKSWAHKILLKELNHVAVRPLREAADVSTVVDQMPTTLGAYIASQREASGMIESYNELYKQLNSTMSAKVPVWAKARFTKGELKKALESKAYAEEYYPAVENRGEGRESLFVTTLNLAILASKSKGLDPQIFQKWLDTRNQKSLAEADSDEDNFDLSAMSAEMLKVDSAPTEATQAQPDAAQPTS